MIDVDGKVIDAGELLRRVNELVEAIDTKVVPERGSRPASPPRELHLDAMTQLRARSQPPAPGRGPGLRGAVGLVARRAALRMIRWYIDPLWETQRAYDDESWQFLAGRNHDFVLLSGEVAGLRRDVVRLKLQLYSTLERMSALQTELEAVAADHQSTAGHVRAASEDVQTLRSELTSLMERVGVSSVSGVGVDYVAFEDRFRGDSAEIRRGQERYLSLVPRIGGRVVDIGCGRGEMVELLLKAGFDAVGVDMDARMVEESLAKGLPVERDDGLHYLEVQDDDSLAGVICLQVVEHLTTAELERLIRLAYRKLKDGGSLVMETINPRSSFALSNHFYTDTSHTRPVHPETLRFICEQVGFHGVSMEERSQHPLATELDRLPDDALGDAVRHLLGTVYGFQDYFVAANK